MNSMSCNTSSIHFWVTWIEERYPPSVYSSWTRRHPLLPITAVLLYLFGISVGQKLMSTRKPFHLKQLLLLWNLSLAVFSIMTTIRLITGIGCTLRQMSLSERLCFTNVDSVSMFWGFLFVFSKFAEFGDTLFLILRKKDVIFLHS